MGVKGRWSDGVTLARPSPTMALLGVAGVVFTAVAPLVSSSSGELRSGPGLLSMATFGMFAGIIVSAATSRILGKPGRLLVLQPLWVDDLGTARVRGVMARHGLVVSLDDGSRVSAWVAGGSLIGERLKYPRATRYAAACESYLAEDNRGGHQLSHRRRRVRPALLLAITAWPAAYCVAAVVVAHWR